MYGQPIKIIGQGSYGMVYQTDKNYAMKIMHNNDDQCIVHACREYLVSRMVESAYCMPILDIDICTDVNYVDYCDKYGVCLTMPLGQPLGKFSLSGFRDIVLGLKDLHDKNILHTDLKLYNCIQLPDRMVLADFGGCLFKHSYYSAGNPITSLYVQAPEVLLGGKYNKQSDIWSLGCLLYEWLTGQMPFGMESEVDVLFNQFRCLGTPNEDSNSKYYWPNVTILPDWKSFFPQWPANNKIFDLITDDNLRDLLHKILVLNPSKRLSLQEILNHPALQCSNNDNRKSLIISYPIDMSSLNKLVNLDNITKYIQILNLCINNQYYTIILDKCTKILQYVSAEYDLQVFYIVVSIYMNFDIRIDDLLLMIKFKYRRREFIMRCLSILYTSSLIL